MTLEHRVQIVTDSKKVAITGWPMIALPAYLQPTIFC